MTRVTEAVLGIVILGCVLIQGGFYPTASLLAVLVVGLLTLPGRRRLDGCDWCLWGLAGLYLIASLAKGYAADSLTEAMRPCACAVFLLAYRGLPPAHRQKLLSAVLIGSAAFAGVSILAFCQVIALPGAVSAHRLQFTFQYANAAGGWFGACALLAQSQQEALPRKGTIPMLCALFLTRSIGALGAYAIVQALFLFTGKERAAWRPFLLQHGLAAAFSVFFYFAQGWLVLPGLALLAVTAWEQGRLVQKSAALRIPGPLLVLGVWGCVGVVLSRRLLSSLRTFLERLVQILDGSRAILGHPLLGLGAGNWKYLYPFYQSAQYDSTVIHSSPIQIGVDAGVLALAAAVAFAVLAWRRGRRTRGQALAALLLMLQCLFDFTLCFLPIDLLLLALLFADEGGDGARERSPTAGLAGLASVGLRIFSVICCAALLFCELRYKAVAYQSQTGSWSTVEQGYLRDRALFGDDRRASRLYIRALYQQGKLDQVLAKTDARALWTEEEVLTRAAALRETGRQDAACRLLLERLSQTRSDPTMFAEVADRLLAWDAAQTYREAYDELAEQANQEHTILGELKGDQVYIDKIEKRSDQP